MSKNITDNNLATDAKSCVRFWDEHPDIKLKETTPAEFKKIQTAFQVITDELVDAENRLQSKMAERDAMARQVSSVMTRLRSAVRGFYGPDSTEYQQVGGTRQSDRKPRTRSRPATPLAAAA